MASDYQKRMYEIQKRKKQRRKRQIMINRCIVAVLGLLIIVLIILGIKGCVNKNKSNNNDIVQQFQCKFYIFICFPVHHSALRYWREPIVCRIFPTHYTSCSLYAIILLRFEQLKVNYHRIFVKIR